jgi:nucleoid-associated protein YgaU
MPSRYELSNIVTNSRKIESDGSLKLVRRLSSTLYPNFDTVEDTKIISQEGDRLDALASQYYGDPTFWFVIARSNNLGKGSMTVPPGMILRIPYYTDFTGIDSLLYEYNEEYR